MDCPLRHAAMTYLLVLCPVMASAADLAPPEYGARPGDEQSIPTHFSLSAADALMGGPAVHVWQQGEHNVVDVEQAGGGSLASVRQIGDGNRVDILQQGADHSANVTQEGNRNSFSLTQSGTGQHLDVVQWGDGLSAQAAQR